MIVDCQRGGPGLGTIQPSQSDYNQVVKGGGHGDYRNIVLAPASAQDMYDFVDLGFDLAFRYRNPVVILADGIVGQMMEKVELRPEKPRRSQEEVISDAPWAAVGKPSSRERNIITSLSLEADVQEKFNHKLKEKYDLIQEKEVRYETYSRIPFCSIRLVIKDMRSSYGPSERRRIQSRDAPSRNPFPVPGKSCFRHGGQGKKYDEHRTESRTDGR